MSGAREEPTPRLTVLAGLAVEAGAAAAGARGGVTGAAVVAGTVQAAGGTVAPGGAGWGEPRVSVLPRKARATRAAGRPPSGRTGTRPPLAGAHPARSAARSSPGRRSSCRRPRGKGPRSCRSTRAHSSRQTGPEDSLRTHAGLLRAPARGWTCSGHVPTRSDIHSTNTSRALSGPVSAAWARVYPRTTAAGPAHSSALLVSKGQAAPGLR